MQSVLQLNSKKTGESMRSQYQQEPWQSNDRPFRDAPTRPRASQAPSRHSLSSAGNGRAADRKLHDIDRGAESEEEYGYNFFLAARDLDAALAWPG